MLTDSVKLLDGVIEDGVIKSGNAFPGQGKSRKKGQLFYLDTALELLVPGLYVFDGVNWVPASGASAGGSGEGDETDAWMGS